MSLKPIDSAFPHPTLSDVGFGEEISASAGMTVREKIAETCMGGILASPNLDWMAMDKAPLLAVKLADALIAELAKTEPMP